MSKHCIGMERVEMIVDDQEYWLDFEGTTFEEAIENAYVMRIGRSGDPVKGDALLNFGGKLYDLGESIVREFFNEQAALQQLRCS